MAKVGVIGGGNAGYALACHLSLNGHHVALFEHPNFKEAIEPVQKEGCIIGSAEEDGYKAAVHGIAKIPLATSNMEEVVKFADILILVVPAFGQVPMFELMLPYLRNGQIVVSMPGNYVSFEFAHIMEKNGKKEDVVFVDTSSIPYACRKLKEPANGVFISGIKLGLTTGVHPANRTDETLAKLTNVIPGELYRANNVIEAGFANMNIIFHPPPTLLNTGWIEVTGGNFKFYTEGASPSICRVMLAVDAEKQAIAKALGCTTKDILSIFKDSYGETGSPDLYESIHNSKHYMYFKAPPSLSGRYIAEDLCFNLIPIALLGKTHGVATPTVDTLVHLANTLTGEVMTAKRSLGFVARDGESLEQMHTRMNKGSL